MWIAFSFGFIQCGAANRLFSVARIFIPFELYAGVAVFSDTHGIVYVVVSQSKG